MEMITTTITMKMKKENHEVLLMLMKAIATSAAGGSAVTASDSEVEMIRHWLAFVGLLGRSKNSCSHFKLILCCFFAQFYPRRFYFYF